MSAGRPRKPRNAAGEITRPGSEIVRDMHAIALYQQGRAAGIGYAGALRYAEMAFGRRFPGVKASASSIAAAVTRWSGSDTLRPSLAGETIELTIGDTPKHESRSPWGGHQIDFARKQKRT